MSLLVNSECSVSYLQMPGPVLLSSAFLSSPVGFLVSAPEQYSSVPLSQKASLFFLISSNCRPQRNPLFVTDLVLDSSGVHFSPPVESFEKSLISLFDKGILVTHTVPQLEKVNSFASTVVELCKSQCVAAWQRHPWACTEGESCRSR